MANAPIRSLAAGAMHGYWFADTPRFEENRVHFRF